jgi:hypothetical protein
MIKFFRKIRYDLLEKNKTGKYLKYAIGEIFLVVIGILIALSINNWNENRKSKILEKSILIELKKSMYSDIENQIRPNILQLDQDLNNIKVIEQFLNNELIYHDSISRKFRSLMFSKHFKWEVTAYKILENQGINIIRNPKLKESILSNYNMRYPEVKDFLENFSNNLNLFFRPIMRSNFAFEYSDSLNTKYIPLDITDLLSNKEFKNAVNTAFLNFSYNLKAHKELENEILKTISLIDMELENFNE